MIRKNQSSASLGKTGDAAGIFGKYRALWLFVGIAALIIAADQITKTLAVKYLEPIGDVPLWKGVFHLTYVENEGAAFGMLADIPWLFMIISMIAIAALTVYLIVTRRRRDLLIPIALALICGGGIGNMIDRISFGYVVDFLNVELINFPVFNIADSFVCIGAPLLFIAVLLLPNDPSDRSDKKNVEAETDGTEKAEITEKTEENDGE